VRATHGSSMLAVLWRGELGTWNLESNDFQFRSFNVPSISKNIHLAYYKYDVGPMVIWNVTSLRPISRLTVFNRQPWRIALTQSL